MKLFRSSLLVLASLSIAMQARACDLCACYTPNGDIVPDKPTAFYLSVAEQFTHFGSLRDNGHEIHNEVDQYLNSSITQLVLGADLINDKLTLQLNVPFIYRSFKRPEGLEIENGSVSGLGDLALLLNYQLFKYESGGSAPAQASAKGAKAVTLPASSSAEFSTSLNIIAGLKFPTGDSDRIGEELEEGHEHAEHGGHDEHEHAIESGVHGHDLALGTGSWDGLFGLQSFTRYQSFFVEADIQYTVRGSGSFGYRYANDLVWNAGPGVYFVRQGSNALALQVALSGESKGKDTLRGEEAEDTGITSLFIGPRLLATRGSFSGEVGFDLPLILHNTALQAVPDYRIRAGLTFRF
jgi:hypothetical protein